ncbi:YopX family protein [Enterococcus sp. AZ107]|uniref:YopX family protein n=1 Tax=unclassified Enterococcus TaxID=2608891 RepID=UPI003ED64F7E
MIPKFRAWLKEELEMQDVLAFDTRGHSFLGIEGTNVRVEGWCDYFEVDKQAVIMQSTGLKDLNGVEIFEGDIVSVRNHPFQKTESSVGIEIDGDYKVSWNEYDLTWCAGNLLLARIKPYVTVIGNIHENPELLEETE